MSLDAVAAALSKTDTPLIKSGLSKAETGSRTLTIGEAANLCRVLDVPIVPMIEGEVTFEARLVGQYV